MHARVIGGGGGLIYREVKYLFSKYSHTDQKMNLNTLWSPGVVDANLVLKNYGV